MAEFESTPFYTNDGRVVEQPDTEVWVRSGDTPHDVAEQVVERISSEDFVLLAAIGARAVNQAVKGVAVARELYNEKNPWLDLAMTPYFSTIEDEKGRERTRIMILINEAKRR